MAAESGQAEAAATEVAGSTEEKQATSGDVGTSAASETAASSDVMAINESDHKESQDLTTEPPAVRDEVVAEAQQKADAAVEQLHNEQTDSSKQDGAEPQISGESEQAHASTEQVQIDTDAAQPADQPCPAAAEGSQTAGEDSDQKSSENTADAAASVRNQDTPAQVTEIGLQEQPLSEQPENTGATDEHRSTATAEEVK